MKIKRKNLLSASVLLFLIFGILTVLVQKKVFVAFDLATTVKLQHLIPDFLILPLSAFSLIGTVEVAGLILLVLLIKLPRLDKLIFLFLFGLTGLFELLGKTFVSQTAPPIRFLKTINFFKVPSDYVSGNFFSYPSGHSARTALISSVLLLIVWNSKRLSLSQKKYLSVLVFIFDFLMFFSRIYLGEHWFSDVVGGILLGFGLFFAGFFASRSLRFRF